MNNELYTYRYKLPFRKPLRHADGAIQQREGLILGDGKTIWTEIAPLPGFSLDTLEQATVFLHRFMDELQTHFQNRTINEFLEKTPVCGELSTLPSVRFGLSMIAEQQKAIEAGLPLYSWWQQEQQKAGTFRAVVRCNAVIGITGLQETLNRIKKYQNAGFTSAKLKLPDSVPDALSLITTVCNEFPKIKFRFDANASFSLPDAEVLFKSLVSQTTIPDHNGSHLPLSSCISYIEEPLKDATVSDLKKLGKYGIPLASDEYARSPESVNKLLSHHATNTLILKPTLFGAFSEIKRTLAIINDSPTPNRTNENNNQTGLPVIVSSGLESAVGNLLLTHIAAYIDSWREADHGLATRSLFASDITLHDGSDDKTVPHSSDPAASLQRNDGTDDTPSVSLPGAPGLGRYPFRESVTVSGGHCKIISREKP